MLKKCMQSKCENYDGLGAECVNCTRRGHYKDNFRKKIKSKPPVFKVGDRVKLKRNLSFTYRAFKKGQRLQIVSVEPPFQGKIQYGVALIDKRYLYKNVLEAD